MTRDDVVALAALPIGHPRRLSISKGSRIAKVSRKWFAELVRRKREKGAPAVVKPEEKPAPPPSPPDPAPPPRPAPPEPAPAPPEIPAVPAGGAPPRDLDELDNGPRLEAPPAPSPEEDPLDDVFEDPELPPEEGAGPPPGGAPPEKKAIAAPPDPEDVAAARELLADVRDSAAETVAVYAFRMDPKDPRIDPIRKPGKFMELAMKRNEEKYAWVGGLTRGVKGLVIGFAFDVWRAFRHFRSIMKDGGEENTPGAERPASPPPSKPSGSFDLKKWESKG